MKSQKKRDRAKCREEALALILVRLPKRIPEMGPELMWATAGGKLPRGQTPPPWVRKAIQILFRPDPDRTKPKQISLTDLASFMGLASGMAKGARMLLTHPVDTAGLNPELRPKMVEFQKRMAAATMPFVERTEEAFRVVPEETFQPTPESMIAFDKAKSEAVECSAKVSDEEETVTTELLGFLWMFWREAKAATSVANLHDWLTGLGFISASQKLFEKVCRKIGYKASNRGRKRTRRIPTAKRK